MLRTSVIPRKKKIKMNVSNRPLFQVWNLILPLLVYFVIINVSMSLFAMFATFSGLDPQKQYMMLQTAATAVTIPFILRYYREDKARPTVFWKHMQPVMDQKSVRQRAVGGILMFLAGAALGTALNNMIMLSGLQEISQGYREVHTYFFAGGIFFELLGACLLTPFLEELLYRGVIYARLCDLMILEEEKTERGGKRQRKSRIIAMAVSAFLFGAFHMNLVQFLYAGLLGVLFAWFMEEAGHFYGAFLAHMGANLMAVLRTETSLFSWMKPQSTAFYAATAACFAAGVLFLAAIALFREKK
ncbi:MAG: CPBP family intramembrane metalloprotease [Lachnospiraceae bacterium]|nr:CPBP family intramembrane metalloprotease [Lachnospiraceae bacterium]